MHVDHEAIVLFRSKNLAEYGSNINTATMYPRFRAAAKLFLLAFPTSYKVEVGLSHVNAIMTIQRNRLSLQNSGDLQIKLTNFQPNINNHACAYQAHSSH